jgi:hypothetical protein
LAILAAAAPQNPIAPACHKFDAKITLEFFRRFPSANTGIPVIFIGTWGFVRRL